METYAIRYLDENLNWQQFNNERAASGRAAVENAWSKLCKSGQTAILRLRREWLEAIDGDGNAFVIS